MSKFSNLDAEVFEIVAFIKEEVLNAGKQGCVVGVSGGIDSAVVYQLCKLAFPETTYGYYICQKSLYQKESMTRAEDLLALHNEELPIVYFPDMYFSSGDKKAIGNYYARMRMVELYFQAECNNSLVIGTDNLCENFIGFFTKWGDGATDLECLGQFLKSEVFALGKILNVPDSIIQAVPSAELWDGQTDEGELGFTYTDLEEYIRTGTTSNAVIDEKINSLHINTEHKRRLTKCYKRL